MASQTLANYMLTMHDCIKMYFPNLDDNFIDDALR